MLPEKLKEESPDFLCVSGNLSYIRGAGEGFSCFLLVLGRSLTT